VTQAERPVLAISPANDRLHVGAAATVLPHVRAEAPAAGSTTPAVAWEFYDADGRARVVDETGAAPALVPADAAAPAPGRALRQVLVSRVDLVLAHAQLRLDAAVAANEAAGEPLAATDRARGVRVQGELADVLVMLAALDPDLDPTPQGPNPGSWWHNLWAHFG
jgi:hypothetical protein